MYIYKLTHIHTRTHKHKYLKTIQTTNTSKLKSHWIPINYARHVLRRRKKAENTHTHIYIYACVYIYKKKEELPVNLKPQNSPRYTLTHTTEKGKISKWNPKPLQPQHTHTHTHTHSHTHTHTHNYKHIKYPKRVKQTKVKTH